MGGKSICTITGKSRIINLPTCGGDKKQGLVPSANYGFGLLNNQNSGRTTIQYTLGARTCPPTWRNYKTNPLPIIGGTHRMM